MHRRRPGPHTLHMPRRDGWLEPTNSQPAATSPALHDLGRAAERVAYLRACSLRAVAMAPSPVARVERGGYASLAMNTRSLMFLLLVGCSSGSNGAASAPALDASTESAREPTLLDTGVPNDSGVPNLDASVRSCSPPAAATTYNDAAWGCGSNAGIYVNGIDLCSSSEYGVGCYSGSAPAASLQCSRVSTDPTPSGALFFCCPCAPGD